MVMNKINLSKRSIDIAYREEGQGTPVLLLHGFCGSSAYWNSVVPLLSPTCRVIAPDLPGHGLSGVPAAPYSIEDYADDLSQFLQLLGIEKAVWFGHSLGGYITLAAAERHAGRMVAFGLIHSTAYPDDDKGKENRLKSIQTVQSSGIAAFVDGLVPKLFAPEHVETMQAKIQEAKEIGYRTPPEGAVRALEAMRSRPDRTGILASAECPVLLVAGESDQIIAPEKTFTAHHDRVRQALLKRVGHMSMMEDPQQLAPVLIDFVQSMR